MKTAITGTGCYIPSERKPNEDFESAHFVDSGGRPFDNPTSDIIQKFSDITGIQERRYASKELNTSDIGHLAAEKALEDAGIDREDLDYIIFAHNFGDVNFGELQGDTLPTLATRVKHLLKIKNVKCVAYDMLFGCPGWVEGVIQAHAFIQSGMAKHCLVVGADTLSRVVDKYDRDSMIFADGAGAAVISASSETGGIIAHTSATYANGEAYLLRFGNSFKTDTSEDTRFIKMNGRKIYEFAVTQVPKAMKECLEDSGVDISEVKKIFLHQANEKMDDAIVKRFYRLFGMNVPEGIMPMNIQKHGNSSVATIPTLFDMVRRGEIEGQSVREGDVVIFASVGAGMNINAFVYRC
ncbi:3-oxoacyl-ACP synthase III family protein [Poritiphilus flavus]|uniref:Ketoacyl-ACP synthase III n=1 Tax=Poritiphilus flavus TaxID=2697053 RepID=A0A6L9EH91_9FLAO|nr:ketoacyl-ACP synthase III [Poritiphilus flavus]NAS14160.1 ketoacyl-ACP synthase III [Poritiphilus flavus]